MAAAVNMAAVTSCENVLYIYPSHLKPVRQEFQRTMRVRNLKLLLFVVCLFLAYACHMVCTRTESEVKIPSPDFCALISYHIRMCISSVCAGDCAGQQFAWRLSRLDLKYMRECFQFCLKRAGCNVFIMVWNWIFEGKHNNKIGTEYFETFSVGSILG